MKKRLVGCALSSAFILLSIISLAQTSSTAPTEKVDAAAIDAIWQKASSKYDAQRAKLLKEVREGANDGPFRPDWGTLEKYQTPEWYRDAKFGIFIHWGVYSVPAFANEWYPHNIYIPGTREFKHHVANYGPQSKFGYKDFIPMFKAQHFDAHAWAELFRDAGAKYVVPVAEHHDGFAMYDSDLSDWTVVKMGPKRDTLGELAQAVRAEGMHFGASSHRIEHDWFLNGGRTFDSDVNDPKYAAFYGPAHPRIATPEADHNLIEDWTYLSPQFMDDWEARTGEIIQKYHPDLIYFDWWIGQASMRGHLTELVSYYYNQTSKSGTVGVIDYKDHALKEGTGTLDVERGQLSDIHSLPWQTDTSLSNASWGYIENDTFKTPEFIIQLLADVVSKNGNLLLNVGPRSDGTIPDQAAQILRQVGAWLKVNGEGIYGTRPWKKYGEGPTQPAAGAFHEQQTKPFTAEDFRFTSKDGNVYAIEFGLPAGGQVVVHSFISDAFPKGEKVQSVSLLGSDSKLQWQEQPDGLHIQIQQGVPAEIAYTFRIVLGAD
jgi:alpha-L-fucosidase